MRQSIIQTHPCPVGVFPCIIDNRIIIASAVLDERVGMGGLVEMRDFEMVWTSTMVSVRPNSLSGARSVSRLGKCRAGSFHIVDGLRRATHHLEGCCSYLKLLQEGLIRTPRNVRHG